MNGEKLWRGIGKSLKKIKVKGWKRVEGKKRNWGAG